MHAAGETPLTGRRNRTYAEPKMIYSSSATTLRQKALQRLNLFAYGSNCTTHPGNSVRSVKRWSSLPVSAMPWWEALLAPAITMVCHA